MTLTGFGSSSEGSLDMHLFTERGGKKTGGSSQRTQLITLAVDTVRGRGEVAAVHLALLGIHGVEGIELDPMSDRVWIFADGTIEPQSLVDALELWGYGSYVLENEFTVPA